jgi:hypothetical protein
MSSNVNAPRNNNASIFTAVVCACLGVLVAGTPVHANVRRASSEVYRFESASSVIRRAFAPSVVVTLRKLKQDGRWLPRPLAGTVASAEENLYQNDKPLAELHSRVVVTRLARAGLPESLA